MQKDYITERLIGLKDGKFKKFQERLIPTVPPESIIGVRTPELRALAKELSGRLKSGERRSAAADEFMGNIPHKYFEENQLHAFIINEEKDFHECVRLTEIFLPCVDNWATCDQLSPGVFKKHHGELLPHIDRWLGAGHTYTVRFGMGMLMRHFLDDDFSPEYLEKVASVKSGEYYIKMMQAWYFATALAKQYDAALPYIERRKLEPWTHGKTIQKACESLRIPQERKTHLRSLAPA